MKLVRSLPELGQCEREICLAIGVFDGVHRGHQAVIRAAVDAARAAGRLAAVMTFDPHPMRVLAPAKAPRLLTSTPHKLRLIGELGVEVCLLVTFDRAFAALEPTEFIDQIAANVPRLREICVGAGFRFGQGRRGTIADIRQSGPRHGYRAIEIPSEQFEGATISSTAIRQLVQQGVLGPAAAMLGRPFTVLGTVEPGEHLGQELGFPTANLNPHNEVLPPDGVYAVRARHQNQPLAGVANIGCRPTVSTRGRRVFEVHLFDWSKNLYGQELEVEFVARLRDERKFASREELRTQIAADVAQARARLDA